MGGKEEVLRSIEECAVRAFLSPGCRAVSSCCRSWGFAAGDVLLARACGRT